MDETLNLLEFDKLRSLLGGFTCTSPGRELAERLRPLTDLESAKTALTETAEMIGLMEDRGVPPVGGSQDLRPAVGRVRVEGARLEPPDFLAVLGSVQAAASCRKYFKDGDDGLLSGLTANLDPLKGLEKNIRKAIGDRGEILDGASDELYGIRQDLQRNRQRIRRTLEDMLGDNRLTAAFQDRIVTQRNGRYVVPVRADHRRDVPGFVHDESASGQTLFVEPVGVLEENNRLQALLRAEKREEDRVLARLSAAVRGVAAILLSNQDILARLDFRAAAGRMARLCKATVPVITEEALLDLKEARHPLLLLQADGSIKDAPVIPIDLRLGGNYRTLVISGPNTGGKTVALKTAGLLVLMVKSGLAIPCHPDSRIGFFDRVCADIGDEQSIELSLSTFSGHLLRIGRILATAGQGSLVLLDELGTGTDPVEGGALGLAVLDVLRERGSKVMVTTHLNQIKAYATLREGVEIAAVDFDRETLEPRYQLHYGMPGGSSAFSIAARLGLPDELLSRAESYLGEGEREGLALIDELGQLRERLAGKLGEAEQLAAESRRDRDLRRRELDVLKTGRREILERAAKRAEKVVSRAEDQISGLVREAREKKPDTRNAARLKGAVRAVRQDVDTLRPGPGRRGRQPEEVAAGELLWIPALAVEGVVTQVLSDRIEMTVGGKKLRLPPEQLEQYSPRRFKPKNRKKGGAAISGRMERPDFRPRLVLVGKRVDEALAELDRFLDDALLSQQREVEVVHGSGEGILRRAVREFLAESPAVQGFGPAPPERGGENVTCAELRAG